MIHVEDLGKCFHIYDDPTQRLKQALWRGRRHYFREFWALRNVSFEVRRGETLGVIGRNGSGKSTLLQILCGTLTPSEGQVQTRGRVAALLELGSGFNPEFTGIENIYLNASLFGLSREETAEKLEDILAFADIGNFVHQPVKTYSSGMSVRLAFAVVAHVDADILVVDEALSVGDAFFNQKCFRFLNRQREEKCLLFVSHDTQALRSLCNRAILLEAGRIKFAGEASTVSDFYLEDLYIAQDASTGRSVTAPDKTTKPPVEPAEEYYTRWRDYRQELRLNAGLGNLIEITPFDQALLLSSSFGTAEASLESVHLVDAASGLPLRTAMGGELVDLSITARAHTAIRQPIVGFIFKDSRGMAVLGDNTCLSHPDPTFTVPAGATYFARFRFTLPVLAPGDYAIAVSLAAGTQDDHRQLQWQHDALILHSESSAMYAGIAGLPMQEIEFGCLPHQDSPSSKELGACHRQ
jgi:lipopolysaccharide transport system ATP-binding protein